MKKSDLRNGMAVKLRDRSNVGGSKFGLVVDDLIYLKDDVVVFEELSHYDEDLVFKYEEYNNYDIMEIYNIKVPNKIKVFINQNEKQLELIWKRDDIDWSKVPVGTEVLVSRDNKEWVEAYYLNNCNGAFFSHYVLSSHKESTWFYEYCKLAEEQENR